MDNGFSVMEFIILKSLFLKLNIFIVFRFLFDNFLGMCLKDNLEYCFMFINFN